MASHGCDWLQKTPQTVTCRFYLCLSETYNCVFVYSMCMRATIVYIYLCSGCIGLFECEAHFSMIIVPASVWGLRGDGGLYLFHSQEGFHGGFREGRGR